MGQHIFALFGMQMPTFATVMHRPWYVAGCLCSGVQSGVRSGVPWTVRDWLVILVVQPTQFNLEVFIRRTLKNSWHQQEASEGLSVCLSVCESWNSSNSIVYKDSFSTSHATQSVCITKTNPLILFRKVMAVGRENNRTVHVNTKMQKRLMLKQMVHIVTAEHQRCSLYRCPIAAG